MSSPRIVSRRSTRISPWVEIIERGVDLNTGGAAELYHAVAQRDYVAIVARTPDGTFPIVRQFRPAVETFTWEFPAGTVEQGEPAEESCRRELLEETGYPAQRVHVLGSYAPCTARLSNTIHSFFVETGPQSGSAEEGIEVKLVTPHELASLIRSGEFVSQLHLGALLLAALRGHLDIAAFR